MPRPVSPTDAHPAGARSVKHVAAAGVSAAYATLGGSSGATPISASAAAPLGSGSSEALTCVHPTAYTSSWTALSAAAHSADGSALHARAREYPSLPACASLLTDAEGRQVLPVASRVSADTYRAMLLRHKRTSEQHTREVVSTVLAPFAGAGSYTAPPSTPLRAADVALLGDALLLNSSLTSLILEHCELDSNALPPLIHLLQQHPSLTELSLASNRLGVLQPDGEHVRHLFSTLASKATLPHLATLNLANK